MSGTMSITPDLAKAFFEAVRAYILWDFANPQPTITIDQDHISISNACERVSIFTDPLPDKTFNALYLVASTQKDLRKRLDAERTYAIGAQCLLKLIENRQAESREEWRRTQ